MSDVDEIIASCDFEPEDIDTSFVSCPPFGVFRSSDIFAGRSQESTDDLENNSDRFDYTDVSSDAESMYGSQDMQPLSLIRNPQQETRLQVKDIHIFHHYIQDVVPVLMPFEDPRNPWSSYPSLALHYSSMGRKSLLYALMAHSSIALANKGHDRTNMLATSTRYYVMAMAGLRAVLDEQSKDYVSLLTTIMTLMFTEVGYHLINRILDANELKHALDVSWSL
jgi:hypothetical protein